ncbi:TPA: hypothetical protein NBS74_004803 [Klebsiella pneumoniae]|nr:hypothetical protein [Klebsiella pneumoniae]
MKKSSGYGSALSLARAISVSARAGASGSLGCGSGQPYSQRALGQFGLQPVGGSSHVAAVGGFKQRVVRGGAGNQPRAVHLPDGGDVVGDLLLGRAQLPAAG